MSGAKDAPAPDLAAALGNLLYVAHLGVIVWWLVDRSPDARGTAALVDLLEQAKPVVALMLPLARPTILAADAIAA